MCGLIGWALPARENPRIDLLRAGTQAMFHRGPDDEGVWAAKSSDGEWSIGFGHRRLAILDLTPAGAQPMVRPNGDALVFNGEIYNYIEIRRELAQQGIEIKGDSDTAVLLELLSRFGAAAVHRLRGMFAFAFWNAERQTLLLGRDQYGKKPLFVVHTGNGGILFGSEINSLLQLPGIDTAVDRCSVREYFQFRYVPGPNTFFETIKKLQPGMIAEWKAGRYKAERYFSLPARLSSDDDISAQDAVRQFRKELDAAVEIRLRSDAPFGAFLSGGLDSAAVVATMSKHLANPVKTFSVGFAEAEFSELNHARVVAQRFGCDHTEILVTPDDIVDSLPKAILHRGAPVSEPSDIPIMILSQKASSSVKMVLTGEGSDELLAGYKKYKLDYWVNIVRSCLPSAVVNATAPLLRCVSADRRLAILINAATAADEKHRFPIWFGALNAAETAEALRPEWTDTARLGEAPSCGRGSSSMRRLMYYDQLSWLPDNLLERGDRMMMAGSIEGRMPFLDTRIADFASRLPDKLLRSGRGGKWILRQAMKGTLPDSIIDRKKIGFKVPVSVWFKTTLANYLRERLIEDSRTAGLYREGFAHKVLKTHQDGKANYEKLIWTMLTLELFAREYRISF